ncbi:MAG: CsbD family protein, partial [Gammaproteobacteria bacterium]|nr:CsbD family protein [Gammaproteobacteria bacterium]MBU1831923.1 CsbD family protein [Gammaproteobacteria bacterium]
MNQDIAEGKWKQLKSQIKEKWADLTDDDIEHAQANNEHFIGVIQERYGLAKDEAKKQYEEIG